MFMVCILVVTCSGCAPARVVLDQIVGNKAIARRESSQYIAFSNGDVTDIATIMSPDDLRNTVLMYDQYRSSVFQHQLNDLSEQTIYNAFEYALEHCCKNILFTSNLVKDTDQLHRLLTFLSLDSPLLEQNLSYEIGTITTYYPVNITDWYTKNACFDGYYITVHNFDTALWEKKLEAIEQAEHILTSLNIPEFTDSYGKAECIYRYIGETVSYDEYQYPESTDVYPYLYDTLIRGRSHCDGFANAISLLMNMAGVTCVEKQCTKLDGSDVGHTWNYVNLGNWWYNIDGTYIDWIPVCDSSVGCGPGFAFSDMFQQGLPDYAEHYVVGDQNDPMEPDAHWISASSSDFVPGVIKAYQSHNAEWAYIVLDCYDKDALSTQMQRVANELRSRVYYSAFPLMNNRTALFVYNGSLYNK